MSDSCEFWIAPETAAIGVEAAISCGDVAASQDMLPNVATVSSESDGPLLT